MAIEITDGRLRFEDRAASPPTSMGLDDLSGSYIDLYFGVVDAPQVGKSLLGANTYAHHMGKLEPGEHLFVIFS